MKATDAYEAARVKAQKFVGAASVKETILTSGTTAGINLVAQTYGRRHVGAGDEVLITGLEHHSNIVPWQMLCEEKGAKLRVAPLDDEGQVIMEEFERLLSAAHEDRGRGPRVERAGDGEPRPPHGRARAREGRGHPGGRRAGGAAPRRGREGAGRGLLRRSPPTRSTVRRASASSTAGRRCWRPCRPGRAAGT